MKRDHTHKTEIREKRRVCVRGEEVRGEGGREGGRKGGRKGGKEGGRGAATSEELFSFYKERKMKEEAGKKHTEMISFVVLNPISPVLLVSW